MTIDENTRCGLRVMSAAASPRAVNRAPGTTTIDAVQNDQQIRRTPQSGMERETGLESVYRSYSS
jgi:hypothetical protein